MCVNKRQNVFFFSFRRQSSETLSERFIRFNSLWSTQHVDCVAPLCLSHFPTELHLETVFFHSSNILQPSVGRSLLRRLHLLPAGQNFACDPPLTRQTAFPPPPAPPPPPLHSPCCGFTPCHHIRVDSSNHCAERPACKTWQRLTAGLKARTHTHTHLSFSFGSAHLNTHVCTGTCTRL